MLTLAVGAGRVAADAYDPPANYYSSATGTGTTLKSQLHNIIDGHTVLSYDSARSSLQITDADPAKPGYMLTVYDRTSVHVAAINPGGSIPGWDSGSTWNREHVWPQSRGPGSSGPDSSDLFELRPALTANNGDRGNLNFGGAFGQPFGVVTESGSQYWYPGDVDAGMIARQAFYMAVRYDGSDSSTTDLELYAGNPSTSQGMGNLNRLIEWHYAVVPDNFERRRNQIIYTNYQHNRDPFVDNPELVWSVFVDQANDSRIALGGAVVNSDGSSSLNLDLGSRIVGAPAPSTQSITLNKTGSDGTYFRVTAAGSATSSLSGKFNAFRTNMTDSKTVAVGLNASTAVAGLKIGSVTIDNLDVTTGGGSGRGANDANDTVNLSMAVLDHARPSFDPFVQTTSLSYDFGSLAMGTSSPEFSFDIHNLLSASGYTAALELDQFTASGAAGSFVTNVSALTGAAAIDAGDHHSFLATISTAAIGDFSASYTFSFSDENIPGAANLGTMQLMLSGSIVAAAENADFDGSGLVDGADLLTWQQHAGMESGALLSDGDANGDGAVDATDMDIWKVQFGTSGAAGAAVQSVPEPQAAAIFAGLLFCGSALRRRMSPSR